MESGQYTPFWEEYRRRLNAAILVFVGYLPVCGGVCWWAESQHLSVERIGLVACLVWMIAGIVIGLRFLCWPCPRCGKPYMLPGAYLDFQHRYRYWLGKACLSCGLPKWSPDDPNRS